MQLHQLLFGKSKKKMRVIMIDSEKACQNYMNARSGNHGAKCGAGWHKIEVAPPGSTVWRQKSATVGGNKPTSVITTKQKGHKGPAGYIDKSGFNAHT